ncbi:hypothetical protein KMP11_03175 [Gemella sp. zg-570]|nr:hypothetical protein [Gemella sp. zg-1178]QWQ39520.1 hypothetical protein KMP11_03175 [Gemella sp. zg-570]
MMYLEDEKLLTITQKNKKSILEALEKINSTFNELNIKVAYIKILNNLLKFNKGIENYFYSKKPGYNTIFQKRIDQNDDSEYLFTKIKASLKSDFNLEGFNSLEAEKFFNIIDEIESNILLLFKDEEVYEFNNYLINLINDKKLDDFIWLNTIYNLYKENQSIRNIVNDYRTFNSIEFSDLYKMYLFVTDYNINELLFIGESKVISDEYLLDVNKFFNYMYDLVEDMKNFVAKENKKDILSFDSKFNTYTNIKTPTKSEFISIVRKIFVVMRDLYENDNTKLLLDNVYPVLVKSFYAPLKNNVKIKYEFNEDFIFALEYIQIIIEVMSDTDE